MISLTSPTVGVLTNELLVASLQAAAEGVVITDVSETILWVNQAFTRLTGFTADGALGQTPKLLHSGYHGPAFYEEMWRVLWAGRHWQGIVVNRRKDGSLYQAELSITPLCDAAGKTTNYIAIQRDVTEREDLAAKVKESERQFRRLFEDSPIGCYDTGPDGVIHRANRVVCLLLGYPLPEIIGHPFWEFIDPAERDQVREAALAAIRENTVPTMVERTYVSRSGASVLVEEHQTLDYGSDGRVAGINSAMIDITERTKVQAALEESSRRYESLFANSSDAIFVVGARPDGSFVLEDVNPAFERITGAPRSAVVGKTSHELLPPEQAEKLENRYRICRDEGKPLSYEEVGEFPSGVFHSQVQLTPIPNASGAIAKLAGFARDLSDRFQMEAELRSKEEQLRLVLEASQDGFWDWDVPHRKLHCNQRWAELHGRLANQFELGTPEFLDLVHPDDLKTVQHVIANSTAGDTSHFALEYRAKISNDEWRWLSARGQVVRRDDAGQPLRAIGTVTDITDRKLAEERIRDSEERYRSVVAAMSEGILVQDFQGNVKACNAAARQILGVSEAELKQRAPHDKAWDAICEDGTKLPACERPSAVTLRTGQPCLGVVRGFTKTDGSVQWLSVNAEPLFHPGELGPYGVVSSFTDITAERRNLRELETARKTAEAATHAKGEFLACMSHEIRTPMNGILGMAELLSHCDLDEEQREYTECIQSSGEALITIINDILDFSKIDTGNVKLEQIPFSVRECLLSVAALVRAAADKKSLSLRCSTSPELADLYIGDPGRVRQIVLNLVGNAVKFTDSGEVAIEVDRAPEDRGILIRVIDSGIGIKPDYLPHLFTKFSQADRSTARRYGGTGLGLAISKQLVDLMGGHIEVSSELNRGSAFTVTLPLAPYAAT